MKWFKRILIVLAVLVLISGAALAVAFSPGFQKWAAMKAVNSQPGMQLEAGRLHLGLSGFEGQNIHFKKDGIIFQAEAIEAKFSPMQAALQSKLVIERIILKGAKAEVNLNTLVQDSREKPEKTKTEEKPADSTFKGIFDGLKLPLTVEIQQCEIEAEATLISAEASEPLLTKVQITGGNFAPGKTGKFDFIASARNLPGTSGVTDASVRGVLSAAQSDDGAIQGIEVHLRAQANGPRLPPEQWVGVDVRLQQESTGEVYAVAVNSLNREVEKPLLGLNASYSKNAGTLAGDWRFNIVAGQLDPFFAAFHLPVVTGTGEGTFEANPATQDGATQGKFNILAAHLDRVMPELSALGELRTSGDFDAAYKLGQAQLGKLSLVVSGAKPIVEFNTLQSMQFNPATKALAFANPASDLLQIKITGVPLSWAQPFLKGIEFSGRDVTGSLVVTPAGTDGFVLRTVAPITLSNLMVKQAGKTLLQDATVAVRTNVNYRPEEVVAKLEEFSLKARNDSLMVKAEARMEQKGERKISVQGSSEGRLRDILANFQVPPLAYDATFGMELKNDLLAVNQLGINLATQERDTLFTLALLNPFQANLTTQRILADKNTDLLSVQFGKLPLSLASLFTGTLVPSGEFSGGKMILSARGEAIVLSTPEPLRIRQLTVMQEGKPLISKLDIDVAPAGEYTGGQVKAVLDELVVKSGNARLLQVQGSATVPLTEKTQGEAALNFEVNLPALLAQPVAASANVLSRGSAQGKLTATLQKGTPFQGTLLLSQLKTKADNKDLPSVTMDFSGELKADGSIQVNAPVVVEMAGRKSDLALTAQVEPRADDLRFNVTVKGERLYADDLQLFATALSAAPETKSTPAAAPAKKAKPAKNTKTADPSKTAAANPLAKPARDEKPIWAGVNGQVKVDVTTISYTDKYLIHDLRLGATVDENKAVLETLEAVLKESPLKASGELAFDKKAPVPYALQAQFSLSNFDPGPFLQAMDPSKPPMAEGAFSASGKAAGRGLNLNDLLEKLTGEVLFESPKGVFRGLESAKKNAKTTEKASAVLRAGAFLGKILDAENAEKYEAVEKVGGWLDFATPFMDFLGEINYDRLKLTAVRGDDLNIKLTDFTLFNPEVHLHATGEIQYKPGTPIMDQSMKVELSMAGKNRLEELFAKNGLLDGKKDEFDYATIIEPAFEITGTPASPDIFSLFKQLGSLVSAHNSDVPQQARPVEGQKQKSNPLGGLNKLFQ